MPYINKNERDLIVLNTVGELNYEIHLLLDNYIQAHGENTYRTHNDIMGVLECVKQEFYRRMTAPLEDIKMDENGDVPPYSNSTLCNPCPDSFPAPPQGEDVWDQFYSNVTLPNSQEEEPPSPSTGQFDAQPQFDFPEVSGPLDFDREKKDDLWEREPATDPHDGTFGWWRVDGLRHSAIVHCTSAQGAIIRADDEELVDKSWEMPMTTWIGERLPKSIRC